MKFKAQDKHNQLIENISSSHLVVGVDIAQEIHVARAVSLSDELFAIAFYDKSGRRMSSAYTAI
ncbi:hypothetical protein [Paenibacillus sp. LHD-38]|uniref:hypothetical protein n=1 Tax=Paenibacillus sp. LHD-38 TaxID=3072143 RepID=UPI00280C6572|nr:hypothetical protein [Paenibacillus sp. LHD-38]MDQ8736424.1 hypothetical protein [Paenibacillus sp. LHD-38]